ncbi:MAG: phosphatase PAP2 family protein [Candidatus Lokiarchaeota archaeon]|nr:phosphatase PAP2 family protein [Candidatus Lokiarchaeota archaeon]
MNSQTSKESGYSTRFSHWFPKLDKWDKQIIKKIYFKFKNREHYRNIARGISFCGDPRLWAILLPILGLLGLIFEDFSMLIVFTTGFLQSYFFYYLIKNYFKRPRPFIELADSGIFRLDKTGHGYSFPSGHSHHSTILVGLLILWFAPYRMWVLIFIIIGLVIYNLSIPYSRLISGCHYPSDVVFAIIEAYLALYLHWSITSDLYLSLWNLIEGILFP